MRKKAQNLVEFVVVIPLLIILIFGIMELSLLWRTIQTVQNMALDAAAAAASTYVSETQNSNDTNNNSFNPAVKNALIRIQDRFVSLGLKDIVLTYQDPFPDPNLEPNPDPPVDRPYSYYEFYSEQTKEVNGQAVPIIKFIVDYREPYKNGVITQLTYNYRTLLVGAEFSLPNGKEMVIIPRDIEVSSTKIQQYISY